LTPDARFVYLVRHPVERIRSHYEHLLRLSSETRPLSVAVLEDPKFVNYSRYAYQIDQYLEYFSGDQLLVVTSEELRNNRVATLSRIFGFLGVDAAWIPPGLKVEHYPTRGRESRAFARKLRRLQGYRLVARVAPAGVKSAYRKIATRSTYAWLAPGETRKKEKSLRRLASMPRDVWRELESRLADDVARLRQFLGPEFDGWGIA
jgi:hypothetical protein